MYTLFNNIVSDIFYSIVVCVDFLGTHMAGLVFFENPSVTDWYQSGVDCRMYVLLALVNYKILFCYTTIFPPPWLIDLTISHPYPIDYSP